MLEKVCFRHASYRVQLCGPCDTKGAFKPNDLWLIASLLLSDVCVDAKIIRITFMLIVFTFRLNMTSATDQFVCVNVE